MVWSLVGLPSNNGLLIFIFDPTQTYLPRVGTIHNGLSILTSIINQKNTSQTCLKARMMEAFSQFIFPLPK